MAVIISPNMVLSGSSSNEFPPFPLTHARIGYQSICTESNVSASSQVAGFEASEAVSQFTADYWMPAALPATWQCDAGVAVDTDYIGIAGHTLGSNGTSVAVQYSTNGTTWTTLFSFTPANNTPIMIIYEPVLARFWRLSLSGGTGTPRVGVVYIGESLAMQRAMYVGHKPITMSRRTKISSQMTDGGQFVARSITRKGVATSFSWKNLTANWVREYFDPFAKAARTNCFFIAWRPATFPNEVGYCWVDDDISPENTGPRNLMSVSFEARGWSDD